MIGWLLQHLQLIRKALRGRSESPRRLAAAVALGVLLGLIPKGNLIAAALTVVILGSTANAGAAFLTATVVSFAALLVDPLSHRVGLSILTHDWLYPFWHALYQLPVVPWTNFDHTVVFGGSIVGLLLFYPAYRLSYAFFNRNNTKPTTQLEQLDEPEAPAPEAPVTAAGELDAEQQAVAEPDAPAEQAMAAPHKPLPACQVWMLSEALSKNAHAMSRLPEGEGTMESVIS